MHGPKCRFNRGLDTKEGRNKMFLTFEKEKENKIETQILRDTNKTEL